MMMMILLVPLHTALRMMGMEGLDEDDEPGYDLWVLQYSLNFVISFSFLKCQTL